MNTLNSQERQKFMILIVIGLLYSLSVAYIFASLPNQRLTDDFFPRWHASKMLLTTGRNLYDWTNAREVSAFTGWPHTNQLGYYYPAYLLLFTAPLSIIPYEVARFIWTVFGLWCLWLGTVIFARELTPNLSVNRLTLLLVLMTISVPVLQHTLNAQFNALGVLALALTWRALHQEKYLLAGVWAGGLLFKPQATLLSLFSLLVWSALERNRGRFWAGLALSGVALWSLAEVSEPGWFFHFWRALGHYEPVHSVVDRIWNPYQIISLTLVVITVWLTFCLRHVPASAAPLSGLLIWTLNLNALIVPMFGMLHVVQIEPVFAIFLSCFAALYPSFAPWVWMGTIGLFVAGLLAFVIPLLLTGLSGLQITTAEIVYKVAMPTLLSLASLPLIFNRDAARYIGSNLFKQVSQ
jgi:hypothetical protein